MTKSTNNRNQMNIWRENIRNLKANKEAEEQKKNEMMASGQMYNAMVNEAVELIISKITDESINGSIDFLFPPSKGPASKVEIWVYRAIIIANDLSLYSACYPMPTNPNTGKQYFFDTYKFKDESEADRYIADVLARLPDGVELRKRIDTNEKSIFFGSEIYDVYVKIDLND